MAEGEDDDDQCQLCRFHPAEGMRKHIYTARHKKAVTNKFLPFLKKLDDARKELTKPKVLDGEIAGDRFWCYACFCNVDKHISDGESSILNGGTLAHIASEDHAESSKKFCQRHGVFMVDKTALARLVLENSFLVKYLELVQEATEKLHEKSSRSEEAEHIAFQEKARTELCKESNVAAFLSPEDGPAVAATPSYHTVMNSHGVVQNPTGWHEGQRVWGGGIVKYLPESDQRLPWSVDHLANPTGRSTSASHLDASSSQTPAYLREASHEDSEIGVSVGFTRIARPVLKGIVGNVHTGATPPWLLPDNFDATCQAGAGDSPAIGPSLEEFQQHALRQRFEGSNPKRVGADHVKAVIRQGNSGDATSHDPMWLPNFGRVYNHGARSDTKREFYKELRQSAVRGKRKK